MCYQIIRYTLPFASCTIDVREGFLPIKIDSREQTDRNNQREISVWGEVPKIDGAVENFEKLNYFIFGTGHTIMTETLESYYHAETVLTGELVWHVYLKHQEKKVSSYPVSDEIVEKAVLIFESGKVTTAHAAAYRVWVNHHREDIKKPEQTFEEIRSRVRTRVGSND